MGLLSRLSSVFRRSPKDPDDVATYGEAARLTEEQVSIRAAAKSGPGAKNYYSGQDKPK
jgi:hypothetical protein